MGLKLEVFESTDLRAGASQTVVLDTLGFEEAKLASYDAGYHAGWEDAAAAQSGDQTRISAELARNLQALGFTYHEARQHILRALGPLMTAMVERILPAAARAALAPMILEVLRPLAERQSQPPVTLVLHPSARAGVEALLTGDQSLPVQIEEEETLGEGTAFIRFQGGETQVDLDDAVDRIARAVQDFFAMNQKDADDGQPE